MSEWECEPDRLPHRNAKMAVRVNLVCVCVHVSASATAIRVNLVCVCAHVCISKYCDENNGAGTNNWIPVKNRHSHNIRRKNIQQLSNLITLSNSYAVLDNLYVLPDKATTNIPKVHKALRAQIVQKLERNILFC